MFEILKKILNINVQKNKIKISMFDKNSKNIHQCSKKFKKISMFEKIQKNINVRKIKKKISMFEKIKKISMFEKIQKKYQCSKKFGKNSICWSGNNPAAASLLCSVTSV